MAKDAVAQAIQDTFGGTAATWLMRCTRGLATAADVLEKKS